MSDAARVLTTLIEILGGVNLGFTATLLFGVRRLARHAPRLSAAPPLCILRPCEGAEPELFENLLSSLQAAYSGPRRVRFLVPSRDDPACAVAQSVVAVSDGNAAVIVTAPRPLENRKVAQLAVGLAATDEEIVVCADSDVRLVDGDLDALIAALLDEVLPSAGAAFAAPIEVAPHTLWDRASSAIVVGSPQSFRALYGMSALLGGAPSMAGALCAYRRSALRSIGEFSSVRDCLGEDNALAQKLVNAGHRVALSQNPARCYDGGRGAAAAIGRIARWLQVVRAQRPLLFLSYPLLVAATPLLIILSLLLRTPVLGTFTALVLLLRIALSTALRRFARLSSGLFSALGDVFFGEGLLWLGFLRALGSRRINWRGHAFVVEKGGRLRPVQPIDPSA